MTRSGSPGIRGQRPGGPAGYTLIEVIVTVALLVVIAVTVAPVLISESTAERLGEAEGRLKEITDAAASFHADIDLWPAALSQLVNPITAQQRDICAQNRGGATYTGGERNSWAGPYVTQVVPAGGLPVGIGVVQDVFTYTDMGGYDELGIVVQDVDESDVIALDDIIDADGDSAAGTVRWTAPVGGHVTLIWTIPINAC